MPLRVYIGDAPTRDLSRPGEAKPGEDVHRTRRAPVPLGGRTTRDPPDAGYGVFRAHQGPSGTWHWGVDITADETVPVVAPEGMSVVAVWTDDKTAPFVGYGPAGVLALGDSGVYHLLGHLDPTAWSAGNIPTKGERLDLGDQVGHVSTTLAHPHVHWEVRIQPVDSPATRGANTLDPFAWLNGVARPKGESPGDFPWWLLLLIGYAISKG